MKKQTVRFMLLIVLLFSLLSPSTIAHGAGLTVNSLSDTVAIDGQCILREAIQNANNNAATNIDCAAGSGADTITFSISGTILLSGKLPMIDDAQGLTIDGTGKAVTISGNNLVQILSINGSDSLTLNNLTLANGSYTVHGGAIDNHGKLTITNCVFTGNSSTEYNGGAISTSLGTVTIITDSTFSNNTAAHGSGGSIYCFDGTMTIENTTFTANTSIEGGAIHNDICTVEIALSTFTGNSVPNGKGGAISNYSGTVTITDSILSGNGASWGEGGGAIYNDYTALNIVNSTFSGNIATGSPGGAIYNDHIMNISKSTFSTNSAGTGGAIFNEGDDLTIANSSFSGNSATAAGDNGGGVANLGELIITNSTFSGNSVPDSGGGIGNIAGEVILRNTIVASSISGGNCGGEITNGGNNLDDGTTCGWGSDIGSMSSTNPMLGLLTGFPAYFPLNSGSPAIDKGDDFICAAWPVNNQSQNGVTRPQGVHCDIGSFEYLDLTPPLVQSITRADPNPTSAASVRFLCHLL